MVGLGLLDFFKMYNWLINQICNGLLYAFIIDWSIHDKITFLVLCWLMGNMISMETLPWKQKRLHNILLIYQLVSFQCSQIKMIMHYKESIKYEQTNWDHNISDFDNRILILWTLKIYMHGTNLASLWD